MPYPVTHAVTGTWFSSLLCYSQCWLHPPAPHTPSCHTPALFAFSQKAAASSQLPALNHIIQGKRLGYRWLILHKSSDAVSLISSNLLNCLSWTNHVCHRKRRPWLAYVTQVLAMAMEQRVGQPHLNMVWGHWPSRGLASYYHCLRWWSKELNAVSHSILSSGFHRTNTSIQGTYILPLIGAFLYCPR